MEQFIKCCCVKQNWTRAVVMALVVGTILAMINHFDMFVYGEYRFRRVIQIVVTYLVPFMVSLYSSAMYCRHVEMKKGK